MTNSLSQAESSRDREDIPLDPSADLSLFLLFGALLRERSNVSKIVLLAGLLFFLGALLQPRMYTTTVRFVPQSTQNNRLPSGVGGLAAQFGLSLPSGGDMSQSPEFYAALLQSRAVLDSVVRKSLRFMADGEVVQGTLADYLRVESAVAVELRDNEAREFIGEVMTLSVDPLTSIVRYSIKTPVPQLSYDIAAALLGQLSAFNLRQRQSRARAEREFAQRRLGQIEGEILEAEGVLREVLASNRAFSEFSGARFESDRASAHLADLRQVRTALRQSFEQARLEEVKQTPLFTIIEDPHLPVVPDSRRAKAWLLVGAMVGMLAALIWVVVKEYWSYLKRAYPQHSAKLQGEVQQSLSDLRLLSRSKSQR